MSNREPLLGNGYVYFLRTCSFVPASISIASPISTCPQSIPYPHSFRDIVSRCPFLFPPLVHVPAQPPPLPSSPFCAPHQPSQRCCNLLVLVYHSIPAALSPAHRSLHGHLSSEGVSSVPSSRSTPLSPGAISYPNDGSSQTPLQRTTALQRHWQPQGSGQSRSSHEREGECWSGRGRPPQVAAPRPVARKRLIGRTMTNHNTPHLHPGVVPCLRGWKKPTTEPRSHGVGTASTPEYPHQPKGKKGAG